MIIKLGQNGEFEFTGPEPLNNWTPPYRAGIYAIFTEDVTPRHYVTLYIGESENLSERGFSSHHAYPCWAKNMKRTLYIGTLPMPNSTSEQRREIESRLISYHNPSCNQV